MSPRISIQPLKLLKKLFATHKKNKKKKQKEKKKQKKQLTILIT